MRRKKAETHAAVLKEAASAVRRGGTAGVAVVDVMADAGLTHGGFYAHFDSREGLVRQAVIQMLEEPRDIIDAKTEGLDPRQALDAFIRYYLSVVHRSSVDGVCALPVLAAEVPHMEDAIRQTFAETVRYLANAIAIRLEEIGNVDPQTAAYSALAEMMGAIAIARAFPDAAEANSVVAASRRSILGRLRITGASDEAERRL